MLSQRRLRGSWRVLEAWENRLTSQKCVRYRESLPRQEGTIWYPDGSHANYDEGNTNQAVSYSEGFAGLPKPEGASNTKSYVDHGAKQNEPEPVSFNSANMFTSNVSNFSAQRS